MVAGTEGARLFVPIIPTFTQAAKTTAAFFKKQGTEAGKQFSEQFTRQTKESLKPAEYKVNVSQKDIAKLQRELNKLTRGRTAAIAVDAKADTAEVDKKIQQLRGRINTARAAAIGITVDPASVKKAGAQAEKDGAVVGEKFAGAMRSAVSLGLSLAGFALAGFAARSLRAAGDFQSSMNLLVTAGGENRKALDSISAGIKNLAQSTGTSTDQLAEGMYTIEKAGIRGGKGLNVLKAAAQGAKAENVDLGTMTNALTSIMASYGSKMKDPIKATNELVAAAGASKTTMSDFAASLATVQPIAAAAHIPFDQLGGAIATLTSHGTSAQEATVELSNTIRNLQAPNAVAAKEMAQFGINSQDLASKLGKRGLQGTLDVITSTILSKMGPSGKILLGAFNQSKIAAQDANLMFTKLPKSVQGVASQFVNGKITLADWRKELKAMTPANAALATQWATSENKSKAFNDQLRTGTPQARTYISSLKKMTGGATGLNTALQLTGESSHRFTDATKEIGDAGQKSGKNISTWASTQKTFNVQLDKLKESIQVAGITLGTKLIPVVLSAAHAFMQYGVPAIKGFYNFLQPVFNFIGQHKKLFTDLALGLIAVWTASKLIKGTVSIVKDITGAFSALGKVLELPGGPEILILVAIGVALYEAYKHCKTFRDIVNDTWHVIKVGGEAVGKWLVGPFVNFWKAVPHAIMSGWNAFIGFFTHTIPNFFIHTIPNAITSFLNWVASHWKIAIFISPMLVAIIEIVKHWQGFVNVFKGIWNVIVSIVRVAFKVLKIIVEVGYALIALPLIYAFKAIQKAAQVVWGWIGPYVKYSLLIVATAVRVTMGLIETIWNGVWFAIRKTVQFVWMLIVGWFKLQWKIFYTFIKYNWELWKFIILTVWGAIEKPVKAVWNAISSFLVGAWHLFRAVVSFEWHALTGLITSIWGDVEGPLKHTWNAIAGFFSYVWGQFKKTAKDSWHDIAHAIPDAFNGITGLVSKHWTGILQVIESPLKLIVKLINDFIGFLNKVPGVHIPTIPTGWLNSDSGGKGGGGGGGNSAPRAISQATGGILPGYTPGRDVHRFVSPTGGMLDLSGGESVMRPEWTAAVGAQNVHRMNAAARKGGVGGVQAMLAGDPGQQFLFGGIIKDVSKFGGYVGSKAKGAAELPEKLAKDVWSHAIHAGASIANKAADALPNGMAENMAHGFINAVANALAHDGNKDIKDKMAQSGVGGGSILAYAKTFLGTPYVWGGAEPGGFDCSGLVQFVLNHFGIHAPRTAAMQQKWAGAESQAAAMPGDQVFWGNPAHHTAFYYGGGKILEAPTAGDVVKIASLYGSPTFGRDPGVGASLLGAGGIMPTGGGSKSANRALGKKIAAQMGFASQWDSIDYVASHESSWNNTAQNPKSSAFGIPQFIDATWPKYGGKTTNPATQIRDMILYMVDRYGSPDGAANYWSVHHNYRHGGILPMLAGGGIIPPGGTAIVGEAGPEMVHAANGGIVTSAAATKKLLAARTATSNARTSLLATGSLLVHMILSGMNGAAATSEISATTAAVRAKIEKAFTGSRKSALVTWVNNENTALQRAAKARDKLSSQIAAANSYATDVRGAAKSNAGITGLSNTAGVNTIQAGLQQKLKQTQQFTADIKTLSRKGLSRELIGQLIDAGVDSGGPIARQLAKASGSRIRQLNATQHGIDTASAKLGSTAANFKFGDNASKDFVAGLVKQRSVLSHEMSLMAESFARNVRRAFTMKASATHTKGTHDSGGLIMPGEGGINLSRHPEAVLTAHQWSVAERAMLHGTAAPSADDIGKAVAAYMDGARLYIAPNGATQLINTQNVRNNRKSISGR